MQRLLLPITLTLASVSPAQRITPDLSPTATASCKIEPATDGVRLNAADGWIEFDLAVETSGRYRTSCVAADAAKGATFWVEDYVGNPDGRTYDITGKTALQPQAAAHRDGSPLQTGSRRARLHFSGGPVTISELSFELLRAHQMTPTTLFQSTEGDEWVLVWSDEFDGKSTPREDYWTCDLGNWGWGNNELQYYTEGRPENARQEGGNLVIEARRGDLGQPWTSARLTTRGKISFLYGKVELRAKVPATDGAWAAGWFLGDAYRDEKSWPYCGEIDVLEGVGREIDDATGNGINHASCHTRAFYFKQGNHISNRIDVKAMADEFHTYTLEWYPDRITVALDGEVYYVYDKTNGPLEWPFDKPQNLILNLAMGGGMGGEVDPAAERVRYVIDYVRVFGRR